MVSLRSMALGLTALGLMALGLMVLALMALGSDHQNQEQSRFLHFQMVLSLLRSNLPIQLQTPGQKALLHINNKINILKHTLTGF